MEDKRPMTTKRKKKATKRLRDAGSGELLSAAKAAQRPKNTVVAETRRKPIGAGWVEVDDDGVPDCDMHTGDMLLFRDKEQAVEDHLARHRIERRGWNVQYVKLVPARAPRKR
jgi:hypothetical protein